MDDLESLLREVESQPLSRLTASSSSSPKDGNKDSPSKTLTPATQPGRGPGLTRSASGRSAAGRPAVVGASSPVASASPQSPRPPGAGVRTLAKDQGTPTTPTSAQSASSKLDALFSSLDADMAAAFDKINAKDKQSPPPSNTPSKTLTSSINGNPSSSSPPAQIKKTIDTAPSGPASGWGGPSSDNDPPGATSAPQSLRKPGPPPSVSVEPRAPPNHSPPSAPAELNHMMRGPPASQPSPQNRPLNSAGPVIPPPGPVSAGLPPSLNVPRGPPPQTSLPPAPLMAPGGYPSAGIPMSAGLPSAGIQLNKSPAFTGLQLNGLPSAGFHLPGLPLMSALPSAGVPASAIPYGMQLHQAPIAPPSPPPELLRQQSMPMQAMQKQEPVGMQVPVCAACSVPITEGAIVTALDRAWHPAHFVCSGCESPLNPQEFFEREDEPFCETCFKGVFAATCAYCEGGISDGCISALGNTWHPHHFFCSCCGKLFPPGTGFLEKDNKAYCEEDYFSLFATMCSGCGKPVIGEYVSAVDAEWHPECFTCSDCDKPFPSGVFFEYKSRPFCELHYNLRTGSGGRTSSRTPPATSPRSPRTPPISPAAQVPALQQPFPRCPTCRYDVSPMTPGVIVDPVMSSRFHPTHYVCRQCKMPVEGGILVRVGPDGREIDGGRTKGLRVATRDMGGLVCRACSTRM